jgi:hypothetical protein
MHVETYKDYRYARQVDAVFEEKLLRLARVYVVVAVV